MRTLYVFFYLKTRQEIWTGAVMSEKGRRTNKQTDARQIIMGKTSLKGSYLVSPTPLPKNLHRP